MTRGAGVPAERALHVRPQLKLLSLTRARGQRRYTRYTGKSDE